VGLATFGPTDGLGEIAAEILVSEESKPAQRLVNSPFAAISAFLNPTQFGLYLSI
jgi:hypothetical protein